MSAVSIGAALRRCVYNTAAARKVDVAYLRRVAVMISESLRILLLFVCSTPVALVVRVLTACACTFMPLNKAAPIPRIIAPRRMVPPVLSLFIVVVFMVFSSGFG